MFERVIRGGRVALGDEWAECDIGIEGGRIAALGQDLVGTKTIEAGGRWVLPGGIDPHCHLDQPPWKGVKTADGFETGTVSAAIGGTTCIIPFAMPAPSMDSVAALERSLDCARGHALIDYGLHGVVTAETGRDRAEQFARLTASGATSVKAFTTYEGFALSDDDLLATFDAARANGMTVLVHAENDAAIRRTRERLIGIGSTAIRYHAVAHSIVAEREATHRVIALSEIAGARLVIVHVSCGPAADEVARARIRGVPVVGETCPQYLVLTARDLDRPADEAVRFVFSPPPRGRKDQRRLWAALREGELSLWSSDHAPYRLSDKLAAGPEPAFHEVANGIPGLATRLPLLFSEGLITGRLTLARYLDLTSRNAASVFGLDHLKGRIEVGLDADLAIWDPAARWTIRHADLCSAVDFTPYEGRETTGRPMTVLVRGIPVVSEGVLSDAPGFGRFVPRRPADPATFPPPVEDTAPWLDT